MSERISEDRIEQFSKSGPFIPRTILRRLIAAGESRVLDSPPICQGVSGPEERFNTFRFASIWAMT